MMQYDDKGIIIFVVEMIKTDEMIIQANNLCLTSFSYEYNWG